MNIESRIRIVLGKKEILINKSIKQADLIDYRLHLTRMIGYFCWFSIIFPHYHSSAIFINTSNLCM